MTAGLFPFFPPEKAAIIPLAAFSCYDDRATVKRCDYVQAWAEALQEIEREQRQKQQGAAYSNRSSFFCVLFSPWGSLHNLYPLGYLSPVELRF